MEPITVCTVDSGMDELWNVHCTTVHGGQYEHITAEHIIILYSIDRQRIFMPEISSLEFS